MRLLNNTPHRNLKRHNKHRRKTTRHHHLLPQHIDLNRAITRGPCVRDLESRGGVPAEGYGFEAGVGEGDAFYGEGAGGVGCRGEVGGGLGRVAVDYAGGLGR